MLIWDRARQLAAQTPPQRNRYVDFLRAFSILVVIVGHWLMTTVYFSEGELIAGRLLRDVPAIQWLTWIFQVMPIFFIVGGYANAVSLDSARRKGTGYAEWLAGRLNRLITPLLALIAAWTLLALLMAALGAGAEVIRIASRAALIPTWFLAIYVMVVVLSPLVYPLWRRFGFVSFWALVALALATDLLFFAAEVRWPGWSNYFWVWLAIHNLGFAWRDGRLGRPLLQLACAGLGLLCLWLLVFYGPYPLAMVGSPDQNLSNTTPPKVALIALGLFQFGLLRLLEKPARRALAGLRLWTATVLVNSMIMTIYLWHLTVMIVVIGLLYLAGGIGLVFAPGSGGWWLTRPLWIALLAAVLVPLALLLSPLERILRDPSRAAPPVSRQVPGAAMICLGIALLALFGLGGGPLPGLGLAALGLVAAGAALGGLLPGRGR